MERWAANTLRTLGIILTAGFVLVTSAYLALMSSCAANGGYGGIKRPDEAFNYAVGAVLVAAAGVAVIAWLARGIYRSRHPSAPPASDGYWPADPSATASAPHPSTESGSASPPVPLHLSPLGRKSIDRLVLAIGAQIALSAFVLIFNQIRFWSGPHIFAPFPAHSWFLVVVIPFVLYHIPYGLLIYFLLLRPDRRAFTYALAVPAVLIMQALLSLGYFGLFSTQHSLAMILLIVPWAVHILILVLAYQSIQQVGLHPEPASLIVAALASFLFFGCLHVITGFFVRYSLR